jgi:hypothetical protein
MAGKSGMNSRLGLEFREHATGHRKSASITSFHQGVCHDPAFPRQTFNIAQIDIIKHSHAMAFRCCPEELDHPFLFHSVVLPKLPGEIQNRIPVGGGDQDFHAHEICRATDLSIFFSGVHATTSLFF